VTVISGTSETFCRIAIKGAIRDKKPTLSVLRINPRKKILGAAEGGLSHRWLDLPVWVHRHIEAGIARGMKESEQLLAQGLPVPYECLKAKGQHSIEAVPRRQREDVCS
jgi:hypothetical protein